MSIKRNEGESFEDFKLRRAEDNALTKALLKPKLFWDTFNLGTYTNPEKRAYKAQHTKFGRKQNKGN